MFNKIFLNDYIVDIKFVFVESGIIERRIVFGIYI